MSLDLLRRGGKDLFEVTIMATATKHPRVRTKARRKLAPSRPAVAGGEVGAVRRRYGLSQALLARLLDVSLRTVSGAESAGAAVPPQLRRNVTQVSRLCEALAEAMEPAFVGQWLDQPNDLLGGLKPVEAIERGHIDLVWQVAEGLRSGSPL
jgi:DNA-binding transcriptional regulator YiaG